VTGGAECHIPVQGAEAFARFVHRLDQQRKQHMRIRVIDLEVENHEYLGHTASPYCPENYIVLAGWQDFNWSGEPLTEVETRRFKSRAEAEDPADPWFQLHGVDFLVAHNAMFEMQWFFDRYREEFTRFLQRGGRVLCTAQAEYHLSHQLELYPSLDETAPKYGGSHKVDGIKILWEQGYLTSQIDPDLLLEYLAGPEGDVANTARVFFGQREKLVQAGMWDMYLARCEGLIAYTLCGDAGLYVNTEIAEANLAEQEAELAELNQQLLQYIPEDLPDTLEFNWGSLHHVSALLFGGPVRYKQRVPYDPPKYEKRTVYRFKDGAEIECTPEDIPKHEQEHGPVEMFKAGKNKGTPKPCTVDSDVEKLKWGEGVYQFKPKVPVSTLPAMIQERFDPKRGDWCTALTLADDKTPVYSTGGEVLSVLAAQGYEIAEAMARRAQIVKDNGTYYRAVEYNKDGSVKKVSGMLQYVQPDGIIHSRLNCTATVTGRLSSALPNLQNLPRDGTSKVKQMFTSRFGEAGRIIEVDYSALEVVMLAALSGDQELLGRLLSGTDMHLFRLAGAANNWQGMTYDELVRALHDHSHPRHKEVKAARTAIKPRAFAAQYGATAHGIAFATGCTVQEGQDFLDNEAALFPRSIAFRDEVYTSAVRTGERNLHREQNPDGRWTVYHRGYWQSPGGTCYSFREHPQWRDGQKVMDYKPTQIANYPVQGEAGYLVTVSAGRVARWLLGRAFFANGVYPRGRAFLVSQVHDALYFDCHESVVREVGLSVRVIMEDAAQYMSRALGYNIAHVPFPAVAEAGPSMYEKEVIE